MVVVTFALGYFLAKKSFYPLDIFFISLIASAFVCAGVSALNQVIEWKEDALMERTKNRPIPSKQITRSSAAAFGFGLIFLGSALMYFYVSVTLALLAILTAFLYVGIYTPFKKVSWLNTSIGAIPGSLPPLAGYVLANGSIDMNAWALFFILFFWQHSHFYAIAWVCRADYSFAGFKMITDKDPDGKKTFIHAFIHSIFLFLSTLILVYTSVMNFLYLILIIPLSIWFIYKCYLVLKKLTDKAASRLVLDSVIYLPLFTILVILDIVI